MFKTKTEILMCIRKTAKTTHRTLPSYRTCFGISLFALKTKARS
ncbi:leader peptide SpeFL [Oceanisphaera profunda]